MFLNATELHLEHGSLSLSVYAHRWRICQALRRQMRVLAGFEFACRKCRAAKLRPTGQSEASSPMYAVRELPNLGIGRPSSFGNIDE